MTQIIEAEVEQRGLVRSNTGEQFVPAMSMPQAIARYNSVLEFTKQIMKDGKDFGTIPGSDKPSLLKPGAEKLCSFFGLTPQLIIVEKDEDWTGARHNGEPFFYYHYRVQLWRGDYLLGEGDGSCNSMESKYRYRWTSEDQVPADLDKMKLKRRGGKISEPVFAIDKGETGGKYGKPAEYWQQFRDAIKAGTARKIQKPKRDGGTMDAWEIDSTLFRVPNPDIADQVNAIQKMAHKRALVAATLIVCNASEYFTQDIEDMDLIDAPHERPGDAKLTREQWDDVRTEAAKYGCQLRRILGDYHVAAPRDLKASDYETILKRIRDRDPAFLPEPELDMSGAEPEEEVASEATP